MITYTAVDQSGNKATCSFTVQVLGNNFNHNRHVSTSLAKGSVFFRHQLPERKERNAANHEHSNSESHKVVFD